MYPPKAKPGDRVALVSLSGGLPELFGSMYEMALRRLRDEIGIEPVEYPTTRVLASAPSDRARDLHAALADPTVTAVMATIGGDDQITVRRHLDADLLRANPKPIFGYSDNTNLLNYLWKLGIVGYHGGSVMVHFGRGGRTHPAHIESLRSALFESGWFRLREPEDWGDEPVHWDSPAGHDRAADVAARGLGLGQRGPGGRGAHLGRQPGDHFLAAPGRTRAAE